MHLGHAIMADQLMLLGWLIFSFSLVLITTCMFSLEMGESRKTRTTGHKTCKSPPSRHVTPEWRQTDVDATSSWRRIDVDLTSEYPAGTWRQNDVRSTSHRRHDVASTSIWRIWRRIDVDLTYYVASTSIWRHSDVMCLLGMYILGSFSKKCAHLG